VVAGARSIRHQGEIMPIDFKTLGALCLETDRPYKVPLVYPGTEEVIKDKEGREAYIEVRSFDSAEAMGFDRERRIELNRKAVRGKLNQEVEQDPLDEQMRKLASLTMSWHLVDPVTRETIDLPCTSENALEIYKYPKLHWIYRRALGGALDEGNFTPKPLVN
jgi:hypothetical protein